MHVIMTLTYVHDAYSTKTQTPNIKWHIRRSERRPKQNEISNCIGDNEMPIKTKRKMRVTHTHTRANTLETEERTNEKNRKKINWICEFVGWWSLSSCEAEHPFVVSFVATLRCGEKLNLAQHTDTLTLISNHKLFSFDFFLFSLVCIEWYLFRRFFDAIRLETMGKWAREIKIKITWCASRSPTIGVSRIWTVCLD